jgi:hypothetical protein
MYVPAGRVTPGSATDWLNVKYVRLSYVNASAVPAIPWMSIANADAEMNLFNMLVLLTTALRNMPAARQRDGIQVHR